MSTSFYKFNNRQQFIQAGGESQSEYIKEGVSISVIGEIYEEVIPVEGEEVIPVEGEEAPELQVLEFLVNTSSPIEAWAEFETFPLSPKRIFG